MSYISTLEGELVFNDSVKIRQAIQYLHQGDWADKLTINIPGGAVIPQGETAMIKIPLGTYRNLGRNLEKIVNLADDGYVVGTSTEVEWHGFIVTPEDGYEQYYLESWIAENNENIPDYMEDKPQKEEYNNKSNWFDEYSNWQTDCETEFRNMVAPPTP